MRFVNQRSGQKAVSLFALTLPLNRQDHVLMTDACAWRIPIQKSAFLSVISTRVLRAWEMHYYCSILHSRLNVKFYPATGIYIFSVHLLFLHKSMHDLIRLSCTLDLI